MVVLPDLRRALTSARETSKLSTGQAAGRESQRAPGIGKVFVRNGSVFILALIAALLGVFTALIVLGGGAGSAAVPPVPTPSLLPPTDLPAPVENPTAALPALLTPTAAPDSALARVLRIYSGPYDLLYSEHYRRLEQLIALSNDPYLHLVVRPVEQPALEINFGGSVMLNGASTLKAPVLLYAIFRDPTLALGGWETGIPREAYRMIVVLSAVSVNGGSNTLDDFNDFLHNIIGLPTNVGLTWWNYGVTSGLTSNRVSLIGGISWREVGANPYSLDAMVAFYEFLETPHWIEGAINRALATPGYPLHDEDMTPETYHQAVLSAIEEARALMAIPDPEFVTEIERALQRVQAARPDLELGIYGKNGSLRPEDWPGSRWHTIEGVVLTVEKGDDRSQRCIVAYSASDFSNDDLLGAALEYCIALFDLSTAEE